MNLTNKALQKMKIPEIHYISSFILLNIFLSLHHKQRPNAATLMEQ